MSSASNLPNLAMPLTDPSGRLAPAWAQFFLALLARTGNTQGILVTDLQAGLEAGAPSVDLAPIYAMIHAVEAMAAQAIATGPLLARIAELEARIEATGAQLPAPAGYAPVSISGVTRQIPYY